MKENVEENKPIKGTFPNTDADGKRKKGARVKKEEK